MQKINHALKFVQVLTGNQDSRVCLQPLHDSDRTKKRKWFYATIREAWDRVLELQGEGFGIYIVVNDTDGKGRTIANVTRVRALFLDCDGSPLTWAALEKAGLAPHMQSGRDRTHNHFYWLSEIDLADFSDLQDRLARFFGTDPAVKDLPRVMRLPGTLNLKKDPTLHKLIKVSDTLAPMKKDAFEVSTFAAWLARQPVPGEGERNPQLFKFACHGVNIGLGKAERLKFLLDYNEAHIDPPLPESEIKQINANADRYAHGGDETKDFVKPGDKKPFEKWAWVTAAKAFYNKETLRDLDSRQFDMEQNHHFEKGLPSMIVTRDRMVDKFEAIVYEPRNPARILPGVELPILNIYRPPTIQPAKGSVDWLTDHIAYLTDDPREQSLILDYVCFCVANPGEKIHFALVLQGAPGVGKSFFKQLLQHCLGDHNVATPDNEVLNDSFNGWQKHCSLVCIEELMIRGRLELMNRLKVWITEPELMIREMYRGHYPMRNVFNIIAFTNFPDAIKIDETDRRFFVVLSRAQPKTPGYYRKLFKDVETKAAALMHYAQHDHKYTSEWNPKAHAPKTAGRSQTIESNKSDFESWADDKFDSGEWPFSGDIVNLQSIASNDSLPASVRRLPKLQNVLATYLQRRGGECLGRFNVQRKKLTLWAIRNIDRHRAASPDEILEHFEETDREAFATHKEFD